MEGRGHQPRQEDGEENPRAAQRRENRWQHGDPQRERRQPQLRHSTGLGGRDTRMAPEDEADPNRADPQGGLSEWHGDQPSLTKTHGDQPSLTKHDGDQPSLTKTHGDRPSLTKTHRDQPSLTKTHGDRPSLTKTHRDRPSLTKTHGDRPSLTKIHGDQPSLTKAHRDRPSLTKTHGDQPSLTKTHRDQPSLTKTHGDRPSLTKTHGDRPSLTKTHGDRPSLTKTHGDRPSLTKTHGDRPSLTKTHGDRPSLTKTHGDRPSLTKTHGDQPSLTKTHGDQLGATLLVERPWPDVDAKGPEWPGELGPSPSPWRGPLRTAAALFTVTLAYSVCRDVVQPYVTSGRSEAHRLPVLIVNRALPATAISLLAFAHLPDVLARLLGVRDHDRHRAPPSPWLTRWLAARKRLWLLGAGGAALHVAYSLSYPGRLALRYKMLAWSYKQVQEGRASSWDEEDVWRMELYVSLGAMALGALSLLAIAHLPSVRDSLTGRELAFLHDRLGPLALLLSVAHTVVYGWRRWLDVVSYVWCTPPVFLLALLAPCSTLLGMALAAAPCWRRRPALDRGIWAEEEDEEDDKEDEKDLGQFHTDQDIGIEMVTAL
ncbi:uncharacterized protein LOC116944286 isoform X2 [Petromyzon marinus]|uniref:uncharacterized protein LOC116944286 isoform X2 n=1 Tax=Petromyzon marinus TaxID=7757 RepID=UPI003F6E9373